MNQTFLDKHYDNIISNNVLKIEHPDIKYVATKKNITQSHTSYGDKLHIEIYTDTNLEFKEIEFDVIFIEQNHKMKEIQIEINKCFLFIFTLLIPICISFNMFFICFYIIDVIFIEQNNKMKGIQIEIINVEINKKHIDESDEYCMELLESNLQNKDKINKLWAIIKYRFVDNLLSLCRILPLIIDLPDEIDTIVYSQWLLDNGFYFEK